MSLNFFRADCQHTPLTANSFGLCDKGDGTKAYPDTANPEAWIGEVRNDNHLEIVFTAVDKCVLHDNEHSGRGRCDCMLTTTHHLYLVELNTAPKQWLTDSQQQLLSTIDFLLEAHDINRFKKRKAFACNKRHKVFAEVDNETNLALFRRTGFRIDIQAEIIVV